MRQQLPKEAPEALHVRDIGLTVWPGDEFECELPVPGCVNLDAPAEQAADTPTAGQDGSKETGAGDPAPPDDAAPDGGRPARTKGARL